VPRNLIIYRIFFAYLQKIGIVSSPLLHASLLAHMRALQRIICNPLRKMASVPYEPLDIIIVGAGISGLSTAISLRRAGHNVKVSEHTGRATFCI
jgi:NADPH-dependent glutamate synthase beta subunit-like oxidoreductase